jgi:hypothetical protein
MWLTAQAYFCRQVSMNFDLFKNKTNISNFRINLDDNLTCFELTMVFITSTKGSLYVHFK